MHEREWYSTQQVAQVVGITSQWVRRQIDAGRLNARYFDGAGRRTYRIHRTDLDGFQRRDVAVELDHQRRSARDGEPGEYGNSALLSAGSGDSVETDWVFRVTVQPQLCPSDSCIGALHEHGRSYGEDDRSI